MITGTARAVRPSRNKGVKKDIESLIANGEPRTAASSHPCQPLTRRQVREQRVIQRRGCIDDRVVDAVGGKTLLQSVDVRTDERSVLLGELVRNDRNLDAAFEVLERRGRIEREI